MNHPRTPIKGKANEEINDIARSLCAQWGISLPVRDAPWSPSISRARDRKEDQISMRIQYLYFKDNCALQYTLRLFEQYASKVKAGWQFKPQAELDVLPSRPEVEGALRRDSFLKRPEINPLAVDELTELLLRFLNKVADSVKLGVDYKVLEELHSNSSSLSHRIPAVAPDQMRVTMPNNGQDVDQSVKPKQSKLSQFWKPERDTDLSKELDVQTMVQERLVKGKGVSIGSERYTEIPNQEHLYKPPSSRTPVADYPSPFLKQPEYSQRGLSNDYRPGHPASDEFYPGQDMSNVLQDIEMTDVTSPVKDDEIFTTPPSTPTPSRIFNYQEKPRVAAAQIPSNRQTSDAYFRQEADLVRLTAPSSINRKRSLPETAMPLISRKMSRETAQSGSPWLYNVNHMLPTTLSACRSFDDMTSVTSSMTASSTTRTSANTSFNADSLATSFTSVMTENTAESSTPGFEVIQESTRGKCEKIEPAGTELIPPAKYTEQVNLDSTDVDDDYSDNIDVNLEGLEQATFKTPYLPQPPPLMNVPAPSTSTATKRVLGNQSIEDYVAKHLITETPFSRHSFFHFTQLVIANAHQGTFDPQIPIKVPFRQLYEVARVATSCGLPFSDFTGCLERSIEDYDCLWSKLSLTAKDNGKVLPEKSKHEAWDNAGQFHDGVTLTGVLKFVEKSGGPMFEFGLKPLKMETSYRLSRRFGSDRFCVVDMPGVSLDGLPSYLKHAQPFVRQAIIDWLVDTEHCFLGRTWRVFYVKPREAGKGRKGKKVESSQPKHRVYFFAQNGHDFRSKSQNGEIDPRTSGHTVMSVNTVINWFMPAEFNQKQPCLKFFARLALGVSRTIPTIDFKTSEIIRNDDAFSESPNIRKLDVKRSDEKKRGVELAECQSSVMNDGCARISKAASLMIARIIGIDDRPPCVFQGRIGGAKGMWMVDALGESLPASGRDFWIEITDSQLKFEGHPIDDFNPDPARVKFEVHSWSRRLSAASLNFQLLPILANRGVPDEVFMRLLKEDLTAKVSELEEAMDNPLALRKWNQDNYSVSSERGSFGGIEMCGGLPDSLAEKLNWFIEHGFEPKTCSFMKDMLYRAIKTYCDRLENRMNIGLGRSTYAYMIADPLATLEENEIHIGFSSVFRDVESGFNDTMLHNMDVLVARLPANLLSDVQKVRAVFKPELSIYKDVVIFSSKGECSLAEKLSGGDYDGDQAWICWEPSIVDPFQNALVPTPPPLEAYGMIKDNIKISDIIREPDYIHRFLRHAFDFNLQTSMLGACTSYYESLCYSRNSMSYPIAPTLAYLLGHLVDSAKGGLIFNEETWNAFQKTNDLPARLPRPAYKNKERGKPTQHLIDRLVFQVAKGVRQNTIANFLRHFEDAGTWDEDLVSLWKWEESQRAESGEQSILLGRILKDLFSKLKAIVEFWQINASGFEEDEEKVRKGTMTFRTLVGKCREDFLAIKPLECGYHMESRWKKDGNERHWGLLKASALYYHWHSRRCVWYLAGVELGEMKALARERGGYRLVVGGVHEAFKLDRKMVEGVGRREMGVGVVDGGEEDEDEFLSAFEEVGWDE